VAIEVVPASYGKPGVAVFKADTLEFKGYQRFWVQTKNGPYVAVDPQGSLYSSNGDNVSEINRYSMNWEKLTEESTLEPLEILSPPLSLSDEQGNNLTLKSIQGGVFSPSGEVLYLVAKDTANSAADGIQVIDVSTGRRVQYSTNGYGYFNFEYNPSFLTSEEPEGITIWDLDDHNDPRVRGQLHVLVLDNDEGDDDQIYISHYTGIIDVNSAYTGQERGTPSQPFNTVNDANNLAWERARIRIKAGNYPENITFSKRIEVVADGGIVTIGE
jgi:hypothetical protein